MTRFLGLVAVLILAAAFLIFLERLVSMLLELRILRTDAHGAGRRSIPDELTGAEAVVVRRRVSGVAIHTE